MNLGLESDVANPNFAGAVTNPDKLLHIEFYMYEPLDQHKSQMAGKKVYQTVHLPDGPPTYDRNGHPLQKMKDTGERLRVPFIRIMKPGDNTSILEIPVRDDHKARWPEEWLYFASNEGLIDSGANFPGWKIEEWSHVNSDAETLRNLKYLRFHTVEQIAGASDAQVQRLGMGGAGLREAAKQALRSKVSNDINAELLAKDAKLKEQDERLKKLEALITAQQEPLAVSPPPSSETPTPAVPPKKKGRPKGSKNKPKEVNG